VGEWTIIPDARKAISLINHCNCVDGSLNGINNVLRDFVCFLIQSDGSLFPYDFDQNPLPSPSIKFTVENPLPSAEIQATIGHCNHDFSTHDLPLQVGVGVILPGAVV
jgi:hypothetical protein